MAQAVRTALSRKGIAAQVSPSKFHRHRGPRGHVRSGRRILFLATPLPTASISRPLCSRHLDSRAHALAHKRWHHNAALLDIQHHRAVAKEAAPGWQPPSPSWFAELARAALRHWAHVPAMRRAPGHSDFLAQATSATAGAAQRRQRLRRRATALVSSERRDGPASLPPDPASFTRLLRHQQLAARGQFDIMRHMQIFQHLLRHALKHRRAQPARPGAVRRPNPESPPP